MLLTLGLSVVIAYVLLPVARLLVRAMPWRHNHPGLARGTAVGAIYLAGLAALAAFLITVIPPTRVGNSPATSPSFSTAHARRLRGGSSSMLT